MPKYVFLDVDGTLINSKKELKDGTIQKMQELENKEIKFVLCSGRYNYYLLDIKQKIKVVRYLISSNGSMIFDTYTNKILWQSKIAYEILQKVYEYCEYNKLAIAFNTESKRYCNKYYHLKGNDNEIDIINDLSLLKDQNITQFIIGSYDYQKMINVKKFLNKIKEIEIVNISTTMKLKMVNSKNGFFYDVVNKGINKGIGIKKLMLLLNLQKEDCIAIGDHINDLSMFNAVGYKIAMGNGFQELKNKANFITKSNDEDGVKYALDHIEKELL